MWFVIGFGAACILCAYGFLRARFSVLTGVILAASVVIAVIAFRWKPLRRTSLTCIGCAVGILWFLVFRNVYLQPAIAMDGVTAEATVCITDFSYDTNYGVAADGKTSFEGRNYQIRVYVNDKIPLSPGDRVSGRFRFQLTTPDSMEGGTYHAGKGIFLLAYEAGDVIITGNNGIEAELFPNILAHWIKEMLRTCFPEDVYPFAIALLLGDSTQLSYETDTAFQISGIRHVIAVSGLHVSILYGLICIVTVKKRFLTSIVGIPLMAMFAALAGFTPSVSRACIMIGLMMLAQLFDREYDGPTALAFSTLVMMAVNPLVVTAVGMMLSVASVSGIFLFYNGINGWLTEKLGTGKGNRIGAKLLRWFKASFSVTASAMTLTTPLMAYYFGVVSLIGIVTNLLTLWIISFLFYGIMLVCILGSFWTAGGSVVAWVIAWGARFVILTSKLLSSVPMAAVYTSSIYIVFWLIFCYLLLLHFLLSRKRKPTLLVCCVAIGLCVALLASWMEPTSDACRVTVMDVGQGQSILIQHGGKSYLVDCGGDSDEAAADTAAHTLLSQGIRQLDGIVVTHYDADHAAGIANLLTRMDTDILFLPATENDGIGEQLASLTEGEVVYVSENLELCYDNALMTIFGPILPTDSNENSLCVLFSVGNCDILITGDRGGFGERMLLRETTFPKVELLIAGHHGSKYSTCEELLQAVRPETVIISAGADNPYGHPAEELLQRLDQFGCTVYRTDLNGTITYRR